MKTGITMKRAILFIIFAIAVLMISGCQQKYPEQTNTTTPNISENHTKVVKKPVDIVEKRGQITNITDFNELVARASKIQTYKYNLSDTAYPKKEYFYFDGRFVKIILPELRKHTTGEKYDEIFLDRMTKTALSHCSIKYCPKPNQDKNLEIVDYNDYYINDPMEYLYKASNANYTGEAMIGDNYVKVYDIKFENKPARIWLQEYYGYPLKIEVYDPENRVIEFQNMMIDATRSGEVDLPFNFTVKGKEGQWYFWQHYLGEWPKKGQTAAEAYAELLNQTMPQPGSQPKLVLAT